MRLRRKMKTDLIKSHNQVIFYTYGNNAIEVVDLNFLCVYTINVPFEINSILIPSEKRWLIEDTGGNKYILRKPADSAPCPNILFEIKESTKHDFKINSFLSCTNSSLNSNVLSAALKEKIDSPNRLLATNNTYASIAVGFPDLDSFNEFHFWPRPKRNRSFIPPICMENGQIIRTIMPNEVPDDVFPDAESKSGIVGYLEIVDVVNHKIRYIPVPE